MEITDVRVLLVSQHYWPETVGTARRAQLLAEYLVGAGHDVTVLCGRPNHPSMTRYFLKQHDGSALRAGVRIERVPVTRAAQHHTTTVRVGSSPGAGTGRADGGHVPALSGWAWTVRAATYASWVLEGALAGLLRRRRFEVVVAISPLPTGIVGVVAARRLSVPLVFDVQDIWPAAAVQAGILSNAGLIEGLSVLEQSVYQRSRAVVAISAGFVRQLEARGVPPARIHLIPNGVDLGPHVHAQPRREQVRRSLGLSPEDTLVIYTGNLGLLQDLDVLLDAAQALRHTRQIRFLLVGDGVDAERLRQRVEGEGLSQVRFLDAVPQPEIPALLAASDVCFLSLRPGSFTPGTIPSKVYEYLAAGRPVLNLVERDTAALIDASQGGINLPAADATSLRVAIFALHADPGLRSRLGRNGQQHVTREASLPSVGRRYEALLQALVKETTA